VSTIQAFATGTQMPTTHSLPLREEKLTPLNSDDEEASMTEAQKRAQASASRRAQKANSRGLPGLSRFEGAGEQQQKSTQMTTGSQAKRTEGDQRVSTELVPVKKVPQKKSKSASGTGGLRVVVGSG
jgi:pyruvate dehydrogenase complex dehydrogenase (E1) component